MSPPTAERPALFTAAFVTLWLVGFFQEMSFGLMIHLPGFLESIGATEARIGLIYSAGAVVALALRPLMGRVIDQVGRKRIFLVGAPVLALSSAAWLAVDDVGPSAFAVRMVYTSTEILLFTNLLAFGSDIVPEARRAQGFALLGISGLLPIGLGSLIGDLVVGDGDFDRLFVLAAGLAVMGWLLAWLLPDIASRDPERTVHRGFLHVLAQGDLRPLWLLTCTFAVGIMTLFTFMRTYVDEVGIGSVGLYLGTYAAVAIMVRLFGSSRIDRIGLVRMLAIAGTFVGVQFLVLGVTASIAGLVVAAVLGGLGHGFLFPLITTSLVNRARLEERGTALAIFSGLIDMVYLLGAPIVGILIVASGYPTTFSTVSVVILSGLAGFILWERARRSGAAVSDPA
jgi:MFS family permease